VCSSDLYCAENFAGYFSRCMPADECEAVMIWYERKIDDVVEDILGVSTEETQTESYRLARQQILKPLQQAEMGITSPPQYRYLRYIAGVVQGIGDGFNDQALLEVVPAIGLHTSGLDDQISSSLQWIHDNILNGLPADHKVRKLLPMPLMGPGELSNLQDHVVSLRENRLYDKMERKLKRAYVKQKHDAMLDRRSMQDRIRISNVDNTYLTVYPWHPSMVIPDEAMRMALRLRFGLSAMAIKEGINWSMFQRQHFGVGLRRKVQRQVIWRHNKVLNAIAMWCRFARVEIGRAHV